MVSLKRAWGALVGHRQRVVVDDDKAERGLGEYINLILHESIERIRIPMALSIVVRGAVLLRLASVVCGV